MAGSASADPELVVFEFEDVDDAGERVVLSLKLVDLREEFLDSVGCLGEVVAELAFVVGDVAVCADAGVELVLEVGVAVSEQVSFDVGLVSERDDGE